MIWGKEICPTTQKEHWQGYAELNKVMRITGFKKAIGDTTAHVETRKGTREQARDYCKKDNCFEEFGEWISGQGARTDLKKVAEKLSTGEATLKDVMLEEPELYCRYRNGLKDIHAMAVKEKTKEFRELEVIVISGPTGCGKTRAAMQEATYKIEGSSLDWWDGYDEDEVILIDEYDNDIKVTKLLNLLDGYQLRLAVKGGFTYANWRKVYITTNLTREQFHAQAKPAHIDALFRRITEWRSMWPAENFE